MSKSNPLSSIGTSAKRWISSFVSPASQINEADTFMYGGGVTTVASLLGYGKRVARARQAIYDKWSIMESDPIISTALLLLTTSALGGHETSGDLVFVEKNEAITDKKQQKIAEEIAKDITPILNKIAYQVAYTGAAFGDAYARIYTDRTGVVSLYTDEMVRPHLVQPFEKGDRTIGYAVYVGKTNFCKLDVSQMARLKMPRTQWVPQPGVVEKSYRLSLEENDMDALPIMPGMAGGSILYNAEEAYDNLSAALAGIVGQRWLDSIDEQIMTLNMTGMTKDKQKEFTTSIISMLKRSKEIGEKAKKGETFLEKIRHVIPIWGDKQLAALTPMQTGRTGTMTIEDVMLHARMLAGALGVDLSMIGFADQLSGGLGDGGFFRVSAQIAERARVIRNALAAFCDQVIDIHTLKRYGVVFRPQDRPWKINFFGSISALEAEKQRTRLEAMNVGLQLAQGVQMWRELCGENVEMMESFLKNQMGLDDAQAKLFASTIRSQGEAFPAPIDDNEEDLPDDEA